MGCKFLILSSGPCISTDTACSSSLVSTHLAHSALHNYECGAAMAAGTNIMLLADTTAAICQLQALSPVGRCKTFDASADGYGRGEGFTVAILQRQGERSGTTSYPVAVLLSSAVNQGGRSSGLTAPNGPAQSALIRAALNSGGSPIDPSQLGVVSIHGTGTPLGDPIEVGALAQALPRGHSSIAVISNKSCFGHTEGAAGLTGLLAAVGPLQHAALPAIMHLRDINPYVTSALADWTRQRGGRNAGAAAPRQRGPAPILAGRSSMLTGTSSFGMSGVNAHAIFASAAATSRQTTSGTDSHSLPLAWKLQRMFTLAPAHALVKATFFPVGGRGTAQFTCELSDASLTYLWDHQVNGTSCLPPAALLEMVAGARLVVLGDGATPRACIADSAISAGLALESTKVAVSIDCQVELATGAVQVAAGNRLLCSAQLLTVLEIENQVVGHDKSSLKVRNYLALQEKIQISRIIIVFPLD